ncbi:hypothetical protein ACHAWT_001150 [Skeletonema menzelii]
MLAEDELSNAQWLFNRCSKARTSMGTPLTSLELCVKILHVIQHTDEDDDIQIPLMDALKDAKQRDVAFIFELCERAGDLRDDIQLSEEALRAIATDTGGIEEEVSADHAPQSEECFLPDETINFDEMQAYQLRTRVLGLNMPTFNNLWKYLQEAGWTYNSGIYHIPRGKRRTAKFEVNSSAESAFALMDIDKEASSNIQDESDKGEQDEEGPEEFASSNDLVDYLDEYCMPDYRATPAEVEAHQRMLSLKSKAYQRRNKRLRWELLEVAFRDRLNERNEDKMINSASKYGHDNRSCEVCFNMLHPTAPRVACRDCRLVVHTECYEILDYREDTADNSKMKSADEKGLFTCDVCEQPEAKISSKKKEKRWKASQSSGHRIHYHPNAICSICNSNSIAGGMIKIVEEEVTKDKKKGTDLEQWVHYFCLNTVFQQSKEPSAVRTKLDVASELRKKSGRSKGKVICGLCKKNAGVIMKCKGQCGKYFHSLCIQIDRRNDSNYKSIDHLCSDCSIVDETSTSQTAEKEGSSGKRRMEETDQYFDKRPSKRQSTDGENAITAPRIKICVAQAQKLQQSDLTPSSNMIELSYQAQFKEWSYLLSTKQSILLYGLGSKKTVLNAFGEALSNEGDVLNINGYDEDFDLDQLFDHINQIFLGGRVSVLTIDNSLRGLNDGLLTKAISIGKNFASMRSRPLFLLIHTIDGVGFSDNFSQGSLQALSKSSEKDSCPMIRIAASVDNINAAMSLWPPQVEHKFDWAWKMVTTHLPFLEELQDGPQTTTVKKNQKISSTQKRGVAVLQVLSSLAPRHTEVLQLLVAMQQSNANKTTPYVSLKKACMKKMITKSEATLRDILNELSDHEMIISKKVEDGNECLYVPSQIPLDDIINYKRATSAT